MNWDQITAALVAALVAGIGIFMPVLFRLVSRLVNNVGNAWIDKIQDDRTRSRVVLAKDEIGTAVEMISQTLLPAIRQATADGKVTPEEGKRLRDLALAEAKNRLGLEFWHDLMQRMGLPVEKLDEWILAQVEAHVFRHKQANGAPKAPAVEVSGDVGET